MKRYLLILLLLILFASPLYAGQIMRGSGGAPASFCDSQTWNTFTAFRFDGDNTDDNLYACLTSGTETGGLTNSATLGSPPVAQPVGSSGGNALICDGDTKYILFNNGTSYFNSAYGEAKFLIMVDSNPADDQILNFVTTLNEDNIQIRLTDAGYFGGVFEDHNNGPVTIAAVNTLDVDSYYDLWIQVHAKWDTTRCTDGTCNSSTANGDWTQAGEDEFCIRARVYNGGWGAWTAWFCETSATDLGTFTTEPTVVKLGNAGYAVGTTTWFDDLEITPIQPTE